MRRNVVRKFGNQIKTGEEDFLNDANFTGAIFDEETNLMYMNARYYDPSSARMLTTDTYWEAATNTRTNSPSTSELGQRRNLYSYVSNNPIMYTDPTGHKKKTIVDVFGGSDSFS